MKKAVTFFLALLWVLSTIQAQLTFTEHNPIQSWKTINQVTEDTQGNIFVTAQDAYLKYDGSTWTEMQVAGFSLAELTSIAAVDDNDIWIGTEEDGLLQFDGTTWTQHTQANTMLPDDQVNDIKIASNGDIWVATKKGVVAISGSTWTVYDNSNLTLATYGVTDIEFASNGDVWFANHFNAVRLSGSTWSSWDAFDITNTFSSFFNDLAIASNGNIYAGTNVGLVIYNGSSWTETIYNNDDLVYSQVISLTVDQSDLVWMGISNDGLRVHDITTDTPIGAFDNDGAGVPTDQLYTIFAASNNAVWIAGASEGLSEITNITTATNDLVDRISVDISPNPVNDFIQIKMEGEVEELEMTLITIDGKVLLQRTILRGLQQSINVASLDSGIYFIKLQDEKGSMLTEKLVIK